MSTMTAESIITQLNKQTANWAVLYMKLHQYHWFVKGQKFFELHEKFEEYYNEAAAYLDELAERTLTLGGKPISTMKQCIESASIKESDPPSGADQMVKQLISDYTTVIEESAALMQAAESENDPGTADVLLKIKSELEKHVWMLKAYS